MVLPKALQDQEAEADQMYDALYNQEGKPEEAPPDTVEEPVEAAEQEPTEPVEEVPEEEVAPVAEEDPAQDDTNWKALAEEFQHKYEVLQGKYNAEVPRLHQDIGALRAQVDAIAAGRKDVGATAAADDAEDIQVSKLEEEYGEEFVADINKMITGALGPILDPLKNQVSSVASVTAASAQDKYFGNLDALVPDWKTIKDQPGFGDYLNQADPFTGMPRLRLAQAAEASLDPHRVAAFYNAYKADAGIGVAGKKTSAQAKKAAALTPGGSASPKRAADALADDNNKYVSAKEMDDFAEAAKQGKLSEKAEAAMQKKIDYAIANGLVIG